MVELIIAEPSEFHWLIENAVLVALEDQRRVYVVGEHRHLYPARPLLVNGTGDLPRFVEFHELTGSVLRSTLPPVLALRDELATAGFGRLTHLVAIVPALRRPAEAMPLIATARLATAGATLIADPATARTIAHLINPERRIAA